MQRFSVIGIGAGHPDQLTIQAVNALNRLDVLFIPRKAGQKDDLATLRREICRRHLTNPSTRIIEFNLPQRAADDNRYVETVDEWHQAIACAYCELIKAHVPEDGAAGLLVWGDPSLYDSTLRILDRVDALRGHPVARDVIPGVTSMQALTAAHGVTLNDIARPVVITTGRLLRQGFPVDADTALVMLDGGCAFTCLAGADFDIWWGAYLGMEHQLLRSGPLDRIGPEIVALRAEARERHGWIMDIYLLRRRSACALP
ncbi:precorrin-6A synthase (deacetylating) [Camelimonas abortus]|uniref:Precorrin-6A synthase [deacetylating] n=1 Tax=Camelimonas abortus TaxID=1017184 RepID=A0ABV7LII8_9HYPH